MRLREPRLRDETGAEIDMTTGERKSTVVSVRADRLFPQLPAVVTGLEVKHGPVDDYGGCITMDMPAPDPIGPVEPREGDGWFNPETEEFRKYRADLKMWVNATEYQTPEEDSPIAVVPLPDVLLANGDSLSFSMKIDESGKAHLIPPDSEDV